MGDRIKDSVQPLKVFEISIEKRVLVIPLDFHSDDAIFERFDVVDLMGLAFALYAIDGFLDDKVDFVPSLSSERASKALRSLRLPTTGSYNLLDGDGHSSEDIFKLSRRIREIATQDSLRVGVEFHLKTLVSYRIEHLDGVYDSRGVDDPDFRKRQRKNAG